MARLLLIRHGATSWNRETPGPERIRSWADVPLHQMGIDEARRLARVLQGAPIGRIFSSDLQRASDTANIIGRQHNPVLSPILTPELRPWHLGSLQGQEITPKVIGLMKELSENRPDTPVPGGESFNDFVRRVLPSLENMMHMAHSSPEDVAAVVHTRDIRLLESWLKAGAKGLNVDHNILNRDKEISPGGIAEVSFANNGEPQFNENPKIG